MAVFRVYALDDGIAEIGLWKSSRVQVLPPSAARNAPGN
jgi:hypothetical protein